MPIKLSFSGACSNTLSPKCHSSFMQPYYTGDVVNIATTVQQQHLAETKKYLKAVVSAIQFCWLQNISFRGHHNGEALTNPDCFQSERNKKNF